MHYAVCTASSLMIKILLLYNVDINLQDNVLPNSPFHLIFIYLCCSSLNCRCLCLVQYGWTPLHLAVQSRRTDVVRLLLVKGADKTLKNRVRYLHAFCFLFQACNSSLHIILIYDVHCSKFGIQHMNVFMA